MDQVEEVKRKTDIAAIVGQYVALKKMGRNQKGLCPFHAEKTPSFMVNEELGLYKCFGCGAGGDVINFLMEIEGMDFVEALSRLAERVGIKIEYKNSDEGDEKRKLLEIMDLAARYYHYLLTDHEEGAEARKYLKERKISSKLQETFNIGFALPEWDGLINYLVGKKKYKEEDLYRCGLVNKGGRSGYFDKFRGRIMFPLQDSAGKVVGFTGRILPALAKGEEPKYMNSPETEIYHKGRSLYGFFQAKQVIREKKQVVLVEGQMDLISSYSAGVGESVAVGGTALTEEQIEMIARLAGKIIFALDADFAGTAAIKRSIEIAEKRGLIIKVVLIVGGKDPDDIARENPNKWKEMVEDAVNVYEFILKKALEKYPEGGDDRIRKVAEETVPFFAKIEQEMDRDRWVRKLADALGISRESVNAEIDKVRRGLGVSLKEKGKESAEKDSKREAELVRMVIGWLVLSGKETVEEVKKWFLDVEIEGAEGKALVWIFNNKEDETPVKLIEKMPSELKSVVEESLMMKDMDEKPEKRDVMRLTGKILREYLEEKIKRLQIEVAEAEKADKSLLADEKYLEVVKFNKKINEIAAILA